MTKGKKQTGFIKWEDLKAKGFIRKFTKQEIQSSPALMALYKNEIKKTDTIYFPQGFKFKK